MHRLDRETSGCLLLAKRRSALRDAARAAPRGPGRQALSHARARAVAEARPQRSRAARHEAASAARPACGSTTGGKAASERVPAHRDARQDRVAARGRASRRAGRIRSACTRRMRATRSQATTDTATPSSTTRCARFGLRRMFLHAHSIAFVWPETGEEFRVDAPLPPELSAVLTALAEGKRGPADRARRA